MTVREPSALVLAAGLATRLGPLRDRWAKACVPVGATTPLGHLLPLLHEAGVRECWINLHHRPEQVRAEARRSAPASLRLEFFEEDPLLGTGGTLLAVSRLRGGLPDVVVNAKLFTDFPFAALWQMPRPTVVLHPPSDLRDYGGLRYDALACVTGFEPGGQLAAQPGSAVYTGIAAPSEDWLPYLEEARRLHPRGALCLIRHALLPALEDGLATRAHLHPGFWCEVSTPARVAIAAAQLRRESLREREEH